jgi:Holliday junction resolvase RusA-like endonuclease
MKMNTIHIKPLSINRAYQGRRWRTPEYDQFEKDCIWLLPPITLPEPPFHINYTFGMSNVQCDVDGPLKVFQDVLQKKYRFNDNLVHSITLNKVKTKKGSEFISFLITTSP